MNRKQETEIHQKLLRIIKSEKLTYAEAKYILWSFKLFLEGYIEID